MNINDRFKLVRKSVKLNQTLFGEPLGLKQNTVTQIEQGKNPVTSRTIKLLCQVYNVDEKWLGEGVGTMFRDTLNQSIEECSTGLHKDSQRFLLALTRMEKKDRIFFLSTLKDLVSENKEPVEEVPKAIESELTKEEKRLLENFRDLNEEGQHMISSQATALSVSGLYKKHDKSELDEKN